MKFVVKGVNLEVTASLRTYVDEKLIASVSKLLSRNPALASAILEVELIHQTRHHKKGMVWDAAANLELPPRQHIFERASSEDLHAAIDELEEKLRRTLTKYKERSRSRAFRGARQAKRKFRFDRSAGLAQKGRVRHEGM